MCKNSIHSRYTVSALSTISKHTISWSSSDKVSNYHKVNLRSVMAYTCSGMLNIQFEKFAKYLGLGSWNERLMATVSLSLRVIIGAIHMIHDESVLSAVYEEVERTGEQVADNCRGIRIMGHARHACRKNSYHTEVVNVQRVTKMDDVSTQRHEFVGKERVYNDTKSRRIQVRINYTNTQ